MQTSMSAVMVLIPVMVMLLVTIPLDPTTARVTLVLKEMERAVLVTILIFALVI